MTGKKPDNFLEFLQQLISGTLGTILIGAICTIERFDSATMLADVQPLIVRQNPDQSEKDYPLLTNVPVKHLGAGDYVVVPPYKKGDLVWVSFATYDTAKPLSGKKAQTDGGQFALQDACVIGPVLQSGVKLPAAIAGKEGMVLAHKSGSAIQQLLPNKVVFHFGEDKTEISAAGVNSTGEINADKEVTAFKSTTPIGTKSHGHLTTMGPTLGKIPGGEA